MTVLFCLELHEAGCTWISFPNRSEEIPDWFEHRSMGNAISFWFSKEIPTITCIFLLPRSALFPKFNLFLNDKEIDILECSFLCDDDYDYDDLVPRYAYRREDLLYSGGVAQFCG
ncbi:hypothetical protein MTR_6g072980 [Medicago truncatula]|uniref:Uncharacterized protein n=1 Tax=Medicago truncatula TaxID=3880 RepID=G7KII6_MEDTR|nr:hypothetical protein MTR_6g072980 [Medicago truncatula]